MKLTQGVVLGLAAVLAGCAVAPSSSESSQAVYGPCDPIPPPQNCAPYNPAYCDPASNADLGSIQYTCQQYVPCADGLLMYAYATPDCRYCIPYNVCDNHGGPSFPID